MNKVILVGHLVRDPEVRYTQSGKAVASFTVAVNRFGSSPEQREADFIPIVAWERLAETCGNNLTKGRRVLVEGRLQIRSYENAEKQRRYVTEVIAQNIEFLDRKQPGSPDTGSQPADMSSFGRDVFPDEEIPF